MEKGTSLDYNDNPSDLLSRVFFAGLKERG